MFLTRQPDSRLLEPLSDLSSEGLSIQLTREGLEVYSREDSSLAETISQVAGHMAVYGSYVDRDKIIDEAGHPLNVLKAPETEPNRPEGNSYVYARGDDLIIKASMPGHDDTATFRDTHFLHTALAQHGTRVGAPAQLALLSSQQTGQTAIIMERVPGMDLGAFTHEFTGHISKAESSEAYFAGVRVAKDGLRRAIGNTATWKLDDFAVKRESSNILTTGDPRSPDSRLYVIDQRFRSMLSATVIPFVRILDK